MITIIAEKPSVAQEIARIVGARTRKDGYMEGNGYAVTWAFGHLVEIYAEGDDDWGAPLPFLPERFQLRVGRTRRKDGKIAPDPGYAKQLGIIKNLFGRSEYIINAGDAGREGELIQRYIYQFVKGHVPVKRLWISSLTDEAIRTGLKSLLPSSEFDNLYAAGKARSEADWLVGVNATRALTKASGGGMLRSLGRVQTPTLALVCNRFLENRDFVPHRFWTIQLSATSKDDEFMLVSGHYDDPFTASSDLDKVNHSISVTVRTVERKTVVVQPPQLHDLTSLQREANRRYSLSAQETLNAAQSLYEKKLITYPRTGSRFLTEDVFMTLPGILRKLAPLNPSIPFLPLLEEGLNHRVVNEAKITDHHALIPTGIRPEGLSGHEQFVYDLILYRLLEATSPQCELMDTTVLLDCGGVAFKLRGKAILAPGWKAVRNEKEPQKDGEEDILERPLPFKEGDFLTPKSAEIKEGKTKPKPLYTEASLLEAMEHAGREIDDESLKDALKECGLGTPATRAGEIETIIRRGYVERNGKALVPTSAGLSVYEIVKGKSIADVELTARWEKSLSQIAAGKYSADKFNEGIRQLVEEIVEELNSNDTIAQTLLTAETLPGAKCPLCGKAVLMTSRLVRCQDESSCGWRIWRGIAGKTLSEREVLSLLENGMTMELKGFKSKNGKPFQTRLILDAKGKVGFEFVDHDKDAEGNDILCPKCGKPVKVFSNAVCCQNEDCGWKMWRIVAGKTITEDMIPGLLSGKTTKEMKGFQSKGGKRFDAALRLNSDYCVEFVFQKKQALSKKKSSW